MRLDQTKAHRNGLILLKSLDFNQEAMGAVWYSQPPLRCHFYMFQFLYGILNYFKMRMVSYILIPPQLLAW